MSLNMFEDCVYCGQRGMRKGDYVAYNGKTFYYYNVCISCGEMWYEEFKEFETKEKTDYMKKLCLLFQEYNEQVDQVNNKIKKRREERYLKKSW